MIPSPAGYDDLQGYNNFIDYGFGNRDPDWHYSICGTLSKIQYPTGGYDSIIYEANSIFTPGRNCNNPDKTINVSVDTASSGHASHSTKLSIPFTVHCPQTITLNITNNAAYPGSTELAGGVFASFVSSDVESSIGVDINGTQLIAASGQSSQYQVYLAEGTYQLSILVEGSTTGLATFSFTDASDSLQLEEPGLRVQQIMTYDATGQQPLITRYSYNNPSSGRSSGIAYLQNPVYRNIISTTTVCNEVGGQGLGTVMLPKWLATLGRTARLSINL